MENMLNGSRTRRQVYKHTSVYFVKCCLKERVALELMYRKFTQTHSVFVFVIENRSLVACLV